MINGCLRNNTKLKVSSKLQQLETYAFLRLFTLNMQVMYVKHEICTTYCVRKYDCYITLEAFTKLRGITVVAHYKEATG